jgi:hypothetical protein
VDEGARRRLVRDRFLLGVGVIASLLLAVAVAWLPWAAIDLAGQQSISFSSGSLRPFLLGLVVLSIALSAVLWWHPSRVISWLLVLLSVASAVLAIWLALRSIAAANAYAYQGAGYTNTSYELGSVLGVLSAAGMLATSIVRVSTKASPPEGALPPAQSAAQRS